MGIKLLGKRKVPNAASSEKILQICVIHVTGNEVSNAVVTWRKLLAHKPLSVFLGLKSVTFNRCMRQ